MIYFVLTAALIATNQTNTVQQTPVKSVQKLHFMYNKWLKQALVVESSVHSKVNNSLYIYC